MKEFSHMTSKITWDLAQSISLMLCGTVTRILGLFFSFEHRTKKEGLPFPSSFQTAAHHA